MVNRLVSVGDDFNLPGAVNVLEDNLPANLAATALNATTLDLMTTTTTPQQTAAGKRIALDRVGQIERAASATAARIAWEDATAREETFADLSAFSASTMTVSGNKVNGAASTVGGNHAISIPTGGYFRAKGSINLVAGGSDVTNTQIGLSKSTAGGSWVSGDRIALGFSSSGKVIGYLGTNVGGSGGVTLEAVPLASGTYYWTLEVDPDAISITLTTPATIYRMRTKRSTFGAINNFIIFSDDARGAAGSTIAPFAYKKHTSSLLPRTYETAGGTGYVRAYDTADQSYHISVPSTYDSRKPMPVVISCHGNTQVDDHLTLSAARKTLVDAFLAEGWLYAAHQMHSNNWGSPQGVADIVLLYKKLRDRYPLGPVLILGESMGGLAALNAVTNNSLPLAGVGLLDGVINLGWNYASGVDSGAVTDASRIITAYGIAGDGSDYATKTAGYDPALAPVEKFQGVPIQAMASADDTRIPKAQHADVLAAKLTGKTDFTALSRGGAHTIDAHFATADWIPFFKRCLATQ